MSVFLNELEAVLRLFAHECIDQFSGPNLCQLVNAVRQRDTRKCACRRVHCRLFQLRWVHLTQTLKSPKFNLLVWFKLKLHEKFFPNGSFQERKLNIIEFWLNNGPQIFEEIKEQMDPLNPKVNILKLT